MAGLDDLFKGNIVTAVAIGIGAVVLAPVVLRASKPLAKAAIKGGIIAYEKGREAFHEVSEVVEDMVAEVKAEMVEAAEAAEETVAEVAAPVRKARKRPATA
jgi:hypothetical protein